MQVTASDSRARVLPALSPEGIRWRTVGSDSVEILIDVENPEEEPTEADDLVIQSAPLGAFVPFKPVTRVAVSALAPGERRRLNVLVPRRALAGLVLGGLQALFRPLRSLDWIGNLNVHFHKAPERSVEVHRALELRVPPGRKVGVGMILPRDRSQYETEVRCSDDDWQAETMCVSTLSLLVVGPPSTVGSRAEVVVRVTRLRDGKCVPVELTFETTDGRTDRLGCVRA
ncbi:MAG: hypothetical protein ACREIU_10155 [Planctomycetota bacterium]